MIWMFLLFWGGPSWRRHDVFRPSPGQQTTRPYLPKTLSQGHRDPLDLAARRYASCRREMSLCPTRPACPIRSKSGSDVRCSLRWRTTSTPSRTSLALEVSSRRAKALRRRSCSSVSKICTRVTILLLFLLGCVNVNKHYTIENLQSSKQAGVKLRDCSCGMFLNHRGTEFAEKRDSPRSSRRREKKNFTTETRRAQRF